jgi:formate/nitrite transporter FocA (FNT family)
MHHYVDVPALAKVLLYSLVAGVLITASFAFGARSFAEGADARAAARPAGLRFLVAGACFTVAALAVGLGVWFVLDK